MEYYLSSINHCTPSYAGHFFKKHMLSIDQVSDLLKMLPEEKKLSFDKAFADKLYLEYNEKKQYDDSETINKLKNLMAGKKVLLTAPGKHLLDADEQIRKMLDDAEVVSIALNYYKAYNTDYVLATKQEIYESAVADHKNIIVTSNVSQNTSEHIQVINYKEWIKVDEGVNDSAIVIMLNLLKALQVKEVYLAGFDGFSANINDNYVDKALRRPVSDEQAKERNESIKKFINGMKNAMEIHFMTESMYNKD